MGVVFDGSPRVREFSPITDAHTGNALRLRSYNGRVGCFALQVDVFGRPALLWGVARSSKLSSTLCIFFTR
jgi:hypothetical protein